MNRFVQLLLFYVLLGTGQTVGQASASLTKPEPLFNTYLAEAGRLRWQAPDPTADAVDSALYFVSKAISAASTPRQKADALQLRGDMYSSGHFNLGFNTAWVGIDDLVEAGNLYISLRDSIGLHMVYNSLALLYLSRYSVESELTETVVQFMTLSYRAQTDPSFTIPDRVVVDTISAPIPARRETFRRAIAACEQNLAFWQRNGSKPHQMWRSEFLGNLYWKSGIDRNRGRALQTQAARLARELHDSHVLLICLANLSQWAYDTGHFTESVCYAEEGLNAGQDAHTNQRKAIFYDRLYYAHKALGNLGKAYFFKEKNIAINDSLARIGNQEQIDYFRQRIASEKRQRALETELRQRNSYLYIVGIVGLLLLAVGSFFIWRNQTLSQKNRELQAALLQGQTLERHRVAADLHDNLGTTLTSLQWTLSALDKRNLAPAERDLYQTLTQRLNQAYNDVRLLAHNLMPIQLAKTGLGGALQTFVDQLNHNNGVQFALTLPPDLPRFEARIEFEVYSICLELCTNILKHARATEAHITLLINQNQLSLTVSDNGVGLTDETGEGRGLQNIRARTDGLGGTWQITSEPGQGVRHQITVPVRTLARAETQI
jgi:signal transduction histidine kinase